MPWRWNQIRGYGLVWILLAEFCLPAVAVGFLDAPIYKTGAVPNSVAVADFNHDGHLDLATANLGGDVSVLLNNGDGTFAPPLNIRTGRIPEFLVAGDFNGDGNSDLVVINKLANGNDGYLSLLLGKGDGTFQPPVKVLAGQEPHRIAVGDFNGDGNLDVAAVNAIANGTVSVLLGNGDGTFQPPVVSAAGSLPAALAVGDFNHDGKLDLAVTNSDVGGAVSILLGNGNGSFQQPVSYPVGSGPAFVAVGDLNGDGQLDLAVASTESYVNLLFGNGDGSFQPAVNLNVGFQAFPVYIIIADLNHDAKMDLAVLAGTTGDLRLLLGNGDGTFRTPLSYEITLFSLAVGDFDGDGNLDFANNYFGITDADDGVSILLGNGDGTLRAARSYIAGFGIFSLAAADFKGDGKVDVVTANTFDDGPDVAILMGKGDGTFRSRVAYAVPEGALWLTTGDFNLDGKLDLVVAGGTKVSVLLGKGDGTFQQPLTSTANPANSFVVVGDFNSDGKPDVAVLQSSAGGQFSLLLGNGDGTFQAPVTYITGFSPTSLAAGDFNADGKLDLAVSESHGNIIWLGNDDGTFQMAGNYAGGYGFLLTADFNRDGKLDLATTDPVASSIAVLLGNGDGSFQQAVIYEVSRPGNLAVFDMNGDGRLDIVAPDFQGDNLGVLLGNGDGTFRTVVNFPAGTPDALAIGDFNGDHAPDLIYSRFGNTVTVFLNSGGTFVSTTSSCNPCRFGQPVTFTTTVKATFPFVGTPTGTVTFKDGNKILGTSPLVAGQATFTTSSLSVGKHKIGALYSGDSNFNPNKAPPFIQKVNP
jgi:hypothetical protein